MKTALFLFVSCFLLCPPVSTTAGQANKEEVELLADLDGNGRQDRITRTRFIRKTSVLLIDGNGKPKTVEGHYVKYVWYPDARTPGRHVFTYEYGTDLADYWVYELKEAGDLNGDGLKDLIFHAGDDTTDETVYLLQKKGAFKAVSLGTMDLGYQLTEKGEAVSTIPSETSSDSGSTANRVYARWNPKLEVFEGVTVRWALADGVPALDEPSKNGRPVFWYSKGDVVVVQTSASKATSGWIQVEGVDGKGLWVKSDQLSTTSLTETFR